MLKKQSALWIDDEPKKAKAAGDSTKGRKSDREKREAKESGNDKEKDKEKEKDKDREKDRDKDREKDRDKDEKNSSAAPPSKVRLLTRHPLSLSLLPLLVSPLLLLSQLQVLLA